MPRKNLKRLAGLLVAITLVTTLGCQPGEEVDQLPDISLTAVELIRDVEYGRVGDRPLLLDIYRPITPIVSPMPAVIWIHGGGWRAGGKFPSRVESLARHGFFGISIEYRLSGEAQFPAAVEDCKCAVRWLRANAQKYNVDPDRIGVWGSSAGGHLSMMVACADGLEGDGGWPEYSSRVRAACAYFGPSDFISWYELYESGLSRDTAPIQFLGGTMEEKPEAYWLASPVNHVSADDPPLLLVHGDLDPVVPFEQSEIMCQAYLEAGLEVTLVMVSGAGHGFKPLTESPISPSPEEIEQLVLDFFLEHLVYAGH